jgi:uncharacterized membrane protein
MMESSEGHPMYNLGLYGLFTLFFIAGLNHFRAPKFYRPMMPPYLPAHDFLIYLSGVIEVLLAILLLIPMFRGWAAWGLILLLIALMPVHIYMLQERHRKFARLPQMVLWLRIPAQAGLIWWAFQFTTL